MSNRIVPQVYKKIIVDVQTSVGVDFEEYGMDGAVLDNLILKWEEKLMQTKAADFQPAQPEHDGGGSSADRHADRSRTGQTENRGSTSETYGYASSTNGSQPYQSPSQYSANRQYAGGLALPSIGYDDVRVKAEPDEVLRPRGGAAHDGRSSPPEPKPEPNAAGLLPGDEVIDSDLDDSEGDLDDDIDGDDDADVDYVFCVYDKVQRVKNKWKTVLKDGMIHIDGKDYLFQKCNGEFEW